MLGRAIRIHAGPSAKSMTSYTKNKRKFSLICPCKVQPGETMTVDEKLSYDLYLVTLESSGKRSIFTSADIKVLASNQ